MPAAKKSKTKPRAASGGFEEDSQRQLNAFLAKYTPEVSTLARQALAMLRTRYPSAWELVYDNYNALAIGFSPSERASDAIFSIALYPRWVSLFFLQARQLKDEDGLLRGSGTVARHIVLDTAERLDDHRVLALMEQAVERARVPFHPGGTRALIIKSVSAQQRPRVPVPKLPRRTRT